MASSGKSNYPYYILVLLISLGILLIGDKVFDLSSKLPRHGAPPSEVKQVSKTKETAKENNEAPTGVEPVAKEQPQSEIKEEQKTETATPESRPATVSDSPEITSYFNRLLEASLGRKTRNDVVVRYYRHIPDGNKIDELRKYGLYIHERPVEGDLENYESNSIYYGDSVNVDDIRLIAYVMLKQGLPLKVIQPSLYHDDWKARSIEIGTDTEATDNPVMTMTEIRNFSN